MKKRLALIAPATALVVTAVAAPIALGGAYSGTNGPINWGDRTSGMNGVSSVFQVSTTGVVSGSLPAAITTPPSWSRDGEKIAWVDQGMFGTSVKVANADGSGAVTIVSGQSVNVSNFGPSVSISADGTKVAVAETNGTIHLLDASTPNQSFSASNRVVTDSGVSGQSASNPALSSDGKLAYVGLQSNAQGSCNGTLYPTIWVVDISSPGIGTELPGTCVNGQNRSFPRNVGWSPDNTKLIYSVDKSLAPDFTAVINADGTGNPTTVYTVAGNDDTVNWPTFSPDGSQLAMTMKVQNAMYPNLVVVPWSGSAAGTPVVTAGATTRQENISWGPVVQSGSGGSTPTPAPVPSPTPTPTPAATTVGTPTVNTNAPGQNAVVTVRTQLGPKGKYTFIFERPASNEMSREQATGNRVPMQKGSKLGKRVLKKTYTAAVITTTADNAKVVTRALLRKAKAKKLNLRVIYAPTGTAQSESVIKIK